MSKKIKKHRRLPFAKSILAGEVPIAVDVGAARGIMPHWSVFEGLASFIAFEPDPESFADVERDFAAKEFPDLYRVLPVGLSGTGGERAFYVLKVTTGSSLLPPNWAGPAGAYSPPRDHSFREVTISTRRLDDVLDDENVAGVDMIKLDVQGAELEVLDGLGDMLDRVLLLESEMNVMEAYVGQPTFGDYDVYLREHGMVLLDARAERAHLYRGDDQFGYHRDVFGVYPGCPAIAARVWHFDGVYVRTTESLLALNDPGLVRKQIVALCGFNFFAEAHHLAEEAAKASILTASEGEEIQGQIKGWFRAVRLRPYHRLGSLGNWLRAHMRRFGIGKDRRRWAQYMWVNYPDG